MNKNCSMKQQVLSILRSQQDDMVRMLQKWIAIPSVSVVCEQDNQFPFGSACAQMLQMALQDARDLGLSKARCCDMRMGVVDSASGPVQMGIACHLDVVAAKADGWLYDPWSGALVDGMVYGRGSSDNKSAGVAALFALRAIQQCCPNAPNFRVYLGCSEENGSPDFRYYQQNYESREELPPMIVPDAGAAVIVGEWGSVTLVGNAMLNQTPDDIYVESVQSGEATNIIPGDATAVVVGITGQQIEALSSVVDCTLEWNEISPKKIYIRIKGKSCHSSEPSYGKNAAIALLKLFVHLPFKQETAQLWTKLLHFYTCPGAYIEQNVGNSLLTHSLTGIFVQNGNLTFWHNGRLSRSVFVEELMPQIYSFWENTPVALHQQRAANGHFVCPNAPFVHLLQNVYRDYTGKDVWTGEMRGATYASQTISAIAYGQYAGQNPHGINECIPVENIVKTAEWLALTMMAVIDQPEMLQMTPS